MTAKESKAVAWIRPDLIAILDKCRNDTYNGTVDVWMRPENETYVGLVPESALHAAETELADFRKVYIERKQQLIDLAKERDTLQAELVELRRRVKFLAEYAAGQMKQNELGLEGSWIRWRYDTHTNTTPTNYNSSPLTAGRMGITLTRN